MLVSVGAILVADALVVWFFIEPPPLGWVGFAIVATIVLVLAGLTPLVFERTRVSAGVPAGTRDGDERLLVVADPVCSGVALSDEVARRGGAAAVHVVVPLRVTPLHFLTDDECAERREAEEAMSIAVALLRRRGVRATGSVGTDKPLESMIDALAAFAATRVMLVTPPDSDSYWLERGLLERARALTPLPIEQVLVGEAAFDHDRAVRG